MAAVVSRLMQRMGRERDGGLLRSSRDLLGAVALSEKDYLALGADIQGFYERARQVSETASSLMMLGAGDQLEALTRGMNELFGSRQESAGESVQGVQALRAILDRVGGIESRLQSFHNVVRSLQALRNFISIESIRFGDGENGFDSLSEDVRRLALRIHEKSAPVLEQSHQLTTLVSESLAGIQKLEQSRRDKGKRIADSIRVNVQALAERHQASNDKLSEIGSTWQEITASIGEIVSSLQFHDITRQRIEHVDDALKDASGEGPSAAGGPGSRSHQAPSRMGRLIHFIRPALRSNPREDPREVYRLQKAQLLHTREELESAIRTIAQGLRDISDRIAELSGEAKGVTRDVRGSGGSFFTGMEEGLLGLTGAVREHAGIHAEMGKAVERVTSAVSGMEGFLREIVKIGIEMKMIALNAAIHAAHVGDEGLALGVLAEHLHRLSNDTSESIASIGEDLHFIFVEADRLKRCATELGAGSVEERIRMTEELGRMIPVLKDLNEKSMAMLESIDAEGKSLSTEIQDRSGNLPFDGVLRAMDTLVEAIEREIVRCDLAGPARAGKEAPTGSDLNKMAKVYTMEREREVHRSIMGGEPQAEARIEAPDEPQPLSLSAPGSDPAGEKKSDEGLGDNVELF